jgi:hypothetical protein
MKMVIGVIVSVSLLQGNRIERKVRLKIRAAFPKQFNEGKYLYNAICVLS